MNDTLVLDSSNRPIGFVNWKRAVKLFWEDAAEVVREDEGGRLLRSPSVQIGLPRVIRVKGYVAKKVRKGLSPTKLNIAIRDSYTCQYCCDELESLSDCTLDHVIPKSRGGQNTWENLVTACGHCNRKKANNTPAEAGMTLMRTPTEPKPNMSFQYTGRMRSEWKDWANSGLLC